MGLTGLGSVLAAGALSAVPDTYSAYNGHGVRIFSPVPEVGVHPRVLLSPEDLPAWREEVIKTYRGKTFFAKRFRSKRIDELAAIDPAAAEEELPDRYPHGGPGDNHELLYATLDVIYHEDEEQ